MNEDLELLREAWGRPEAPASETRRAARAALLTHAAKAGDASPIGPGATGGDTPLRRPARNPGSPVRPVRPVRSSASSVRPRGRWARRALAVAAAAVVLAGALTAAEIAGQGTPGVPVPVAHAQAVLTRAADAVQHRPFVSPRPDQWIYHEVRAEYHQPSDSETITPQTAPRSSVGFDWTRADGKVLATVEDGKLVTSPTGGNVMPPTDYATISTLPRDPDSLLTWFRERSGSPHGGDEQLFQLLGAGLLGNNLTPPDLEAAIFRALAKIPGVTVEEKALDNEGRPALAVTMAIDDWLRHEIFLDPLTYAYRGERSTAVRDHTGHNGPLAFTLRGGKAVPLSTPTGSGWLVEAGTVFMRSTRVTIGVVDEPGERP